MVNFSELSKPKNEQEPSLTDIVHSWAGHIVVSGIVSTEETDKEAAKIEESLANITDHQQGANEQ